MAFQSAECLIAGLQEYLFSAHGARARCMMCMDPGESLDGYEAADVGNVEHYLTWITLDLIRAVAVDRSKAGVMVPGWVRANLTNYSPLGDSFTALAMYMLHVHQQEHEYNED